MPPKITMALNKAIINPTILFSTLKALKKESPIVFACTELKAIPKLTIINNEKIVPSFLLCKPLVKD